MRACVRGPRIAGSFTVTTVIAVLTTRAGQTSTHWATSLAWSLAESKSVLLVDCDMEGGTIADLLYLRLDDRGIANCFSERPATGAELAAQALPVPQRPGLRVVPGLRRAYGFEIGECLRRLGPALKTQEFDVVIVDLGHPLAHPGLRSPRTAAENICACFHRVFVVIRDDPALLARSVEVLGSAGLAHGEIIICRERSRAHQAVLEQILERAVPHLAIRDCWAWDERRAMRVGETGTPLSLAAVAQELSL